MKNLKPVTLTEKIKEIEITSQLKFVELMNNSDISELAELLICSDNNARFKILNIISSEKLSQVIPVISDKYLADIISSVDDKCEKIFEVTPLKRMVDIFSFLSDETCLKMLSTALYDTFVYVINVVITTPSTSSDKIRYIHLIFQCMTIDFIKKFITESTPHTLALVLSSIKNEEKLKSFIQLMDNKTLGEVVMLLSDEVYAYILSVTDCLAVISSLKQYIAVTEVKMQSIPLA